MKPLEVLLKHSSPVKNTSFLAQMDDPFAGEIALADNRSLGLHLDSLRKRLLRMAERTEPLCTVQDIGGK